MNNITTYLISASLILLVIRQIREHPLDARSLAVPVLAVGAAAVMFLHSVPAGGSATTKPSDGTNGTECPTLFPYVIERARTLPIGTAPTEYRF